MIIAEKTTNKSIDRIPDKFPEFMLFLKNTNLPVYIFGADIAGKVVSKILKNNGVELTAYIDNNKNKCENKINEVEVKHSTYLDAIDRNAIILIASTYISDIINQIESMGFFNWVPIANIIEANRHENFRDMLSDSMQHNYAGGKFTKDFIAFAIDNMVNSQKKYLDENILFIRSVDLIITERCSLKCKDCANLMQFYERPINIENHELQNDLKNLSTVADEINEIRIIGGEPLMNKNFHLITKKAAEYKNINKVVIYTNGTICPSEEKIETIKNDKIFVFITTYGPLSRNVSKLTKLLDKYAIQYNNQPAYGWTDCASIQTHERNEELNKKIFQHCCAKHFTTMTDGKLFRCPFSANVERLNAIPKASSDYVSIRSISKDKKNIHELKKKLRWFLREKSVLDACDSCNGRTYGDPEIIPGIQAKKPLEYVRYERQTRDNVDVIKTIES